MKQLNHTHIGWYWMPPKELSHPFRRITVVEYDRATATRSYIDAGVMAMDDYGTLVPVNPPRQH